MKSRRSGQKKKLSLQLTSLLDMFTIILVFLMVSFQAEDMDFVLNSDLKLPASSSKSPFKTAVNIAITTDVVTVEGNPVYLLESGGKLPEADKDLPKIESIVTAVTEQWDAKTKEGDEDNVIVIQADKNLPYRTIHMVMRSAAHSGFFRFRLVVEKE